MNLKWVSFVLLFAGLALAAGLTIPVDQPICKLYGMIQLLGTVAGVLVAAYAGFTLASSHELTERNTSKALLGGVIIGLIIVWIAPVLVKYLVDNSSICGW
ncbi:TrbC/VirB2 family protein [Candidatus Micrarchaeota archaeon]|nr:TrbC/VirB2 family protein [Candidatus Micrarchaeota archaeon]